MNKIFQHTISFILLIIFQVFIIDKIQISYYISPYIYILFILSFDVRTSTSVLLLLSFFLGFLIDIFESSGGIHAAATVLIGFIRPKIIKLFYNKDDYNFMPHPNIYNLGFVKYATYAAIIILSHHFVLFYLEIFSLQNFLLTFLKVLISTIASFTIILVVQFLFAKQEKTS